MKTIKFFRRKWSKLLQKAQLYMWHYYIFFLKQGQTGATSGHVTPPLNKKFGVLLTCSNGYATTNKQSTCHQPAVWHLVSWQHIPLPELVLFSLLWYEYDDEMIDTKRGFMQSKNDNF